MSQPEALRLANDLDRGWAYKTECAEAAAELRRLHDVNINCVKHFHFLHDEFDLIQTQRNELLEALKDMVSDHANLNPATLEFARAAIAKAEGA